MSNHIREEDERWIVNDLGEKGKNVRNWHWSEKDISQWCCDYLKDILKTKEIYRDHKMKILIKDVRSVTGEAFIFNRKK